MMEAYDVVASALDRLMLGSVRFAPLLALVLCFVGCSPGLDDGALLWRGFNHKWDYNHRMGRMGDRIVDRGCGDGEDSCGGFILHSGAAGPERDYMDYTSWYTRVLAAGVAFAGVDEEHILGARNSGLVERPDEEIRLSIDEFPNLENRDHYAVLLGGFDLESRTPDDKLMHLMLDAGEARWDARAGDVEVSYSMALSMHCNTADCEDNFFEYLVTVSLVVVAWDDGDVEYTEDSLQKVDTWDAHPWCVNEAGEVDAPDCTPLGDGTNPSAVEPELQRITRTIDGIGGTQNAFVGFRRLLIDLGEREAPDVDKAHHMLAFRVALHPGDHDPTTGDFSYSTDMIFKNWHAGMQEADPAARFSYPETGAATWRAEIGLFQLFVYSRIDHGEINGEIEWPAGEEYSGSAAERWGSVEFSQLGF